MIEIYYYSGTGFTLRAAKMLKDALNEETVLTPIVGAMKSGNTCSHAEKIGLFFPMHAFGLPLAIQKFMRTMRIPNARYVFSLVSRGGAPTRIHKETERYLKRQGKKLNAFSYVTAPNTFDPIFKVPTNAEATEERKKFDKIVHQFASVINNEEDKIDLGYRNRFLEYTMFPMLKCVNRFSGFFKLQDSFYSDDNCIGCGKCAQMCLSEKIVMENNRPKWQKNIQCQYCLACLQLCPQAAVQVSKSKSPELERIHEKNINWKEIADQKVFNNNQ